jgi:hypothetical protein
VADLSPGLLAFSGVLDEAVMARRDAAWRCWTFRSGLGDLDARGSLPGARHSPS